MAQLATPSIFANADTLSVSIISSSALTGREGYLSSGLNVVLNVVLKTMFISNLLMESKCVRKICGRLMRIGDGFGSLYG